MAAVAAVAVVAVAVVAAYHKVRKLLYKIFLLQAMINCL